MKPPVVLVIKTGSTYSDLRNTLGDFDTWIKNAAGEINCEWKVKPVANVEPDKIPNYQGVIITGSHSSLTQFYEFYGGMERVVKQIIDYRIYTLAICFGHQLIHKIMGGTVDANPLGTELGVVTINLTFQGLVNPLFVGQSGSRMQVYASHSDIVVKPAVGFVQLAWNKLAQFQATCYDNFIYTTQFHPEYTKEIMAWYLRKNFALLNKQHISNPLHFATADEILKSNKSLPKSRLIIQNFLNLISSK
ncbi:MAG TPA: hypothetical protein P5268_04605 [Candidatus Marinimicrobia bacterium]|nr:hypothetical protein [Candidatus Neomarinimicrobiota bacterium]HRS51621.1 hypothetical protein [Candidatus Neomarinimicrobiota bacterium]HRU92301.1 hypothetical protein [Candidatus Neomarinimicrobiota bacterium]